jgi:hypothetical protein
MIECLLPFLLFLLCGGDCVIMQPQDVGICYPYISSHLGSVYVSNNQAAIVPFATILQQFCQVFVDPPNYRSLYWVFSCSMAFPKCDKDTGVALFICPNDCRDLIPLHLCGSWIPVAREGADCTPLARQGPDGNFTFAVSKRKHLEL